MKRLIEQILKFGVVGFICFLIDFVITTFPTYLFGKDTVFLWQIFGFIVSCTVNYLLSVKFVFTDKKEMDKRKEFIVFVILSIIGLLINEAILYLCMNLIYANIAWVQKILSEALLVPVSKVIATGVVMVYNFISRKLFLEGK